VNRTIEQVIAEAQAALEGAGSLDVAEWQRRYPEHAELGSLLETMLLLHREKRWQEVEEATRAYAVNLLPDLSASAAQAEPTLADLVARAAAEGVVPSLPGSVVQQLAQERTPVSRLDNRFIKELATRVAVRFDELLKEIRRLRSLELLWSADTLPVMTRRKEQSSAEEERALLERVKQGSRKGPEGKR
jgi:hypothetical protein